MQWLIDNWFWVLIGGAFVGMHLFGHGGHHKKDAPDKPTEDKHPGDERSGDERSGH